MDKWSELLVVYQIIDNARRQRNKMQFVLLEMLNCLVNDPLFNSSECFARHLRDPTSKRVYYARRRVSVSVLRSLRVSVWLSYKTLPTPPTSGLQTLQPLGTTERLATAPFG